jgi:hypothetical protein
MFAWGTQGTELQVASKRLTKKRHFYAFATPKKGRFLTHQTSNLLFYARAELRDSSNAKTNELYVT